MRALPIQIVRSRHSRRLVPIASAPLKANSQTFSIPISSSHGCQDPTCTGAPPKPPQLTQIRGRLLGNSASIHFIVVMHGKV